MKLKLKTSTTKLGSIIRNARIDKRLNSNELAYLANVGASTITEIEVGAREDPKLSSVVKICKVLGIDIGKATAYMCSNLKVYDNPLNDPDYVSAMTAKERFIQPGDEVEEEPEELDEDDNDEIG